MQALCPISTPSPTSTVVGAVAPAAPRSWLQAHARALLPSLLACAQGRCHMPSTQTRPPCTPWHTGTA